MQRLFSILTLLATYLTVALHSAGEELKFNRDIRPILSDKCYFCHGPDESTREADMRLDSREEAEYVLEGELLERINSDDPDLLMPPPYSKLELSEEEKQTLKTWIEQGAPYQGHWAFELLPESISVPEVSNPAWCRQTLDHFVLAKQEENELSPSSPADPLRWLRRVTFDLTGLPPTIEQINAFKDALREGEHAYEETVDALLASTAYGEHMAVDWLDAARYADSYGYQSDRLNTQWPYRDWVVRAFNENLAYDDFLTWQLAGDLLEDPTRDQRLATAFNRIHRLNNEGGAVFEEWRIENVADRVHTFGTAVLGLTMECCRCHDHKYDPIPMRDYYSLSAYFNSIDENGVYDNSEKVPNPSLLLPTDEQKGALEQAQQKVREAELKYETAIVKARTQFAKEGTERKPPTEIPDLVRSLSFDAPYEKSLKEIYYPGSGDRAHSKPLPLVEVADAAQPRLNPSNSTDGEKLSIEQEHSLPRQAVSFDGEHGIFMPDVEPFDRWTPFSLVVTLRETKRVPLPAVIAHNSHGQLAFNGWDLLLNDGHLEARMYRVWPGNAIGVRSKEKIPLDKWHQVAVTYDGSSHAKGFQLFLNGKEIETTVLRDKIKKRAMVKVMHGGTLTIGQRWRDRGFDGGLVDDVRVYERALSPTEINYLATGEPVEQSADYIASAIDDEVREALAKLTEARKTLVMAEEVIQEIPIMEEMTQPRETHVLARGEYDAPTSDETRVTRRSLSELPLEFPEGAPNDRLGLAHWVTDPNHPLTARVAVNRFWGNFFSAALVRTPENFGSQGELPTHPELLDWLARDFIDNGWDVKRLCKMIVLSATYRQDSRTSDEKLEADPTNRWLARGPAHRLSAEQIRDLVLAASGLMNPKVGGPPVSPYQPGEDLWREANTMSPAYKQSTGKALYRRSLYSVWKRTAPLPNMLAFDSTTREVCTVKRSRTNTPLQALVLLNDVQFIEAARVMAEELIASEVDKPLEVAFTKLSGRKPDETELAALRELHEQEQTFYAEHPELAKKLLSLGEKKPRSDLENIELAALTNVCQAILNLDVTIWKR